MLTRRKLLKVIMKSIFKDGWRSTLYSPTDSDKISDETMGFTDNGIYYHIRLSLHKTDDVKYQRGGAA